MRRRKLVRIVSAFLFLSALTLAFYGVLFRLSLFDVQNVHVLISGRLEGERLIEFVKTQFGQSFRARVFGFGHMLGWPRRVSPEALTASPIFKTVRVEKDFRRRTVVLSADTRIPVGIWCIQSERDPRELRTGEAYAPTACAWFDREGVKFESTFAAEGNLIPVVNDYSQTDRVLGKKILPDAFVPNLLAILEVAAASDFGIREIKIADLSREEVEIRTHDGPALFFSLRFLPTDARETLSRILAEHPKRNFEYIDFRVPRRVFFK